MEVSTLDTARSLWIIYRQMPDEAQRVFKQMLTEESADQDYTNADWLSLSTLSLNDIWDTPEEDYWDELYAKQHSGK